MTEKRFTADYDEKANRIIYFDNQKPLTVVETLDCLNELVTKCHSLEEENQELKEMVKRLQELATRTEEEKEYFADLCNYFERKKCEYFKMYNTEHLDNIQLSTELEHLKKENEQLKQRLRECGMRIDKLLGNCR